MKLKDLDFLGGNVNFSVDRSAKLKSSIGGFFTIFLTLVIGLLLFGFGRNFFKRENPIVIRSANIPEDYKFINMTTKEISFALRFEDFDGNAIKNDRAFYIKGEYFYQTLKEDGEWDVISEEIELNPCAGLDFPDGPFRSDEVAKDYLCPKFDGKKFGGFWTHDIVSNYIFRAFYCSEGHVNHKGERCVSDSEKDEILKNIAYISLYQEKLETFPLSYNNPLKRSVENIFFVLDKKATKGITVNFKNTTVISDYGWMIEDKKILSKVGVGNYLVDIFNINLYNPRNGPYIISEITLYYSKDSDEYIRQYQKISELAANVGGILEIFLISGYTIVAFYNDCKNMLEFDGYMSNIDNPNKRIKNVVELTKKLLRTNLNSNEMVEDFISEDRINRKKTSATKINDWNLEHKKAENKDLQSENLVLSNNLNDYSTVKGNNLDDNSVIQVSPDCNKITNNLINVNNENIQSINSKSIESEKSSKLKIDLQLKDKADYGYLKNEILFSEIIKSLAFRYSFNGKLCCCSKEKIDHHTLIENKYDNVLSFKKFIFNQSLMERMKEVLFTNEQILILQAYE